MLEETVEVTRRVQPLHPDSHDELEAIALLPPQLLANHGGPALAAIIDWLHHVLDANRTTVVTYHELLQHWPSGRARFNQRTATSVAALLENLGLSIHPDPPLDHRSPTPTSQIELRRIQQGDR